MLAGAFVLPILGVWGEILTTKGWEGSKDERDHLQEGVSEREDGQLLGKSGKLDSARMRPYMKTTLLHSLTVARERD